MCIQKKITHSLNYAINTAAGEAKYSIDGWKNLQNKAEFVEGLIIKMQNAAGTRYASNGRKLVTARVLDNAYLQAQISGTNIIENHPLSHFIHEGGVHDPGTYAALIFPKGIDVSNSYIYLSNTTGVVDNESIEITFLLSGLC